MPSDLSVMNTSGVIGGVLDQGGDDFYEIDNILKVKGKGKNMRCLIHWRGFPDSADSWEPVDHLNEAGVACLNKFQRKHSKR